MKIQCDVCNKEEASVFCSADEAALCDGCDRRVHHANKLASKHIRFRLQHPSLKESPRCDICQERRAFLFCQEDRAILCRECDISIHRANEHTQKHNRFLLTGVKLSASSPSPSSSSRTASSSSNHCNPVAHSQIRSSASVEMTLPSNSRHRSGYDHCIGQENSVSTSSISEYLMETLPGWRVDEFLDPSCYPHGLCKFLDQDLESDLYPFQTEDMGIGVPRASAQSSHIPYCLPQAGVTNGLTKGDSEKAQDVIKISRKWNEDGFAVPQISPSSVKRSRQFG